MDKLHQLVSSKLVGDRALAQLETEAGSNVDAESVSRRTFERVRLALEDAMESDGDFAVRLLELVKQLRQAEGPRGALAREHGLAAGGDVSIHADSGSVASGVIHGDVRIGNPPPPGPPMS
jgi:hypothetical protein